MHAVYRFATAIAVATAILIAAWAAPAEARNRALLVGVSKYPGNPRIEALKAPGNDVRRIWKWLRAGNRFQADDIAVLANDKAALDAGMVAVAEPTAQRILDALDKLAAEAQEDDFIVFYFSGHGTRITQTHGVARQQGVEQDGNNEVLLAQDAGVHVSGQDSIPGGLLDKELKKRFEAIRRKAKLWIIIDSCHAGGATRSASNSIIYKSVDPSVLGLPAPSSTPPPPPEVTGFMPQQQPPGARPVVAFLAVAEDRLAIERKMDVEGEPGTHHSVFTHVLLQTLATRGWDSYRQIALEIERRVGADSKDVPPPVFEGALDGRPFGGQAGWTAEFRADKGIVEIKAGLLAALSKDAIVALKRGETVIGYARIVSTSVDASTAQPIAHAGRPSPDAAALAEPMVAALVRAPVDFELAVALPGDKDCEQGSKRIPDPRWLKVVGEAIDVIRGGQKGALPIKWVEAGAKDAALRLCIRDDILYLVGGDGRLVAKGPRERRPSPGLRVPDTAADLVDHLMTQLWRVVRQQNLVRIAAEVGDNALARRIEVKLRRVPDTDRNTREERKCTNFPRQPEARDGTPMDPATAARTRLTHCDQVSISIRNGWDRDVDVTLLYLDNTGAIVAVGDNKLVRLRAKSEQAQPYDPIAIVTWCPTGLWSECEAQRRHGVTSFGPVGVERLAIVVTEAKGAEQNNYYYLAQEGLSRAPDPSKTRDARSDDFSTLMRQGLAEGTLRSANVERSVPGTIKLFTWEVVPPDQMRRSARR